MEPGLLDLMKVCWQEDPSDRPTFNGVSKRLRQINKGRLGNVPTQHYKHNTRGLLPVTKRPAPHAPKILTLLPGTFYRGGGGRGGIAPLEFWQSKKVQNLLCRARDNRIFLDIFPTFFGCFVRYLDLWATRRPERSTIVDLLIKIPGPLNPAAYWKVHNFFKRSKIGQKGQKSQMPPWRFDTNIPAYLFLEHTFYLELMSLNQIHPCPCITLIY